jgi:predicted nucleic acid-binding protein
MKLIIDANVLFSSLIKDSITAECIFKKDLELCAPDFFIEEFMKYEELILAKTQRPKEKYIEILHCLHEIIQIMPEKEFSVFLSEAERISPDAKDVPYFALALKMKCPVWSNDRKLKEQKRVKVYSTEEIMGLG